MNVDPVDKGRALPTIVGNYRHWTGAAIERRTQFVRKEVGSRLKLRCSAFISYQNGFGSSRALVLKKEEGATQHTNEWCRQGTDCVVAGNPHANMERTMLNNKDTHETLKPGTLVQVLTKKQVDGKSVC